VQLLESQTLKRFFVPLRRVIIVAKGYVLICS